MSVLPAAFAAPVFERKRRARFPRGCNIIMVKLMDKWLPWFILVLSVLLIVAFIALSGCTSSDESSDQQQVDSGSSSDARNGPGPMDAPPDGGPPDGAGGPPPG